MFKKKIISVKLDIIKSLKGHKTGTCNIKVAFPKKMPMSEILDIKIRLNSIIDDIRKYL